MSKEWTRSCPACNVKSTKLYDSGSDTPKFLCQFEDCRVEVFRQVDRGTEEEENND